jgi:Flp pilus assembly pilin Flp
MQRVLATIGHLVREDDGQDLIEYGMLVVLIAIAAVVAVGSVGNTVSNVLWQYIADTSF